MANKTHPKKRVSTLPQFAQCVWIAKLGQGSSNFSVVGVQEESGSLKIGRRGERTCSRASTWRERSVVVGLGNGHHPDQLEHRHHAMLTLALAVLGIMPSYPALAWFWRLREVTEKEGPLSEERLQLRIGAAQLLVAAPWLPTRHQAPEHTSVVVSPWLETIPMQLPQFFGGKGAPKPKHTNGHEPTNDGK